MGRDRGYIFNIDKYWKKIKKDHFEATGIKLVDEKETEINVVTSNGW